MPTRKPAYVKRREGNRSRVPIKNDLETFGSPQEPVHLTPAQLERWHAVVSALPAGLLTAADTQVIERMAIAWALFRETTEKIATTSLLIHGSEGLMRNPLLIVQKAAAGEMHLCGMMLGLSPFARTRLTMPETGDSDPLETLMQSWQPRAN